MFISLNLKTPKKNEQSKFESYSLGVLFNGKKIYIRLTGTQGKKLIEAGNIKGKTLSVYKYTNKYGDNLGFKVE